MTNANLAYDHSRRLDETAIREHYYFPSAMSSAVTAAIIGGIISSNTDDMERLVEWMRWFSILLIPGIIGGIALLGTFIDDQLITRSVHELAGGKEALRGNAEVLAHLNSISAFKDWTVFKSLLLPVIAALAYGAVLIRVWSHLIAFDTSGRWWAGLIGTILFFGIGAWAMYINKKMMEFHANGQSNERGICAKCNEDTFLYRTASQRTMILLTIWSQRLAFFVIGFGIAAAIWGYPHAVTAVLTDWGLMDG